MWIECGFSPDAFWHQSPQTFQLAMQGVRKRLQTDADTDMVNAWQTAAMTGAASAGKLKPLRHYLRKPAQPMDQKTMLANMRMLASRANALFANENTPADEQGAANDYAHEANGQDDSGCGIVSVDGPDWQGQSPTDQPQNDQD